VVFLALLSATPAHPQGLRGTFSARGNVIELRDLERDSLPSDQVAGTDIRRRLEDGTVATCIPDEFCRWYATGDRRTISLVTQDLVVAGWPGLQGVSGHAHLRGRYGSDDFWPRAGEEMEVIAAYASWDRGYFQLRGGRQFRTSRLGYRNFDGAAFLWRGFEPLRIDVYGGWSLAPGLNGPHDGDLLEEADPFPPGERGLVWGVDLRGRMGRIGSAQVGYERVIRTGEGDALYSERASAAISVELERFAVEGSATYDVAFDEVNEALVRVTLPLPAAVELSAEARRYSPFFELWTIWGAFSPTGFDEGRISAAWRVPGSTVRVHGGAVYRSYDETNTEAEFPTIEEDAWRAFGGARWDRSEWFVDGRVLADRGAGAARYGGDLLLGRRFGPESYVAVRGISSQSFSEFRLGERSTTGWSGEGALQLGELTLTGSWGLYDVAFEGQPRLSDWTQQRGHLGVTWRFGAEPAMPTEGRAP
jgi:hypothetical protein